MSETHTATLGAILSLIDGHLVAPLDEVYAVQDFLAGRPLLTHERVLSETRDVLLEQFPRLAEAEFPPMPDGLSRAEAEAHCRRWVDRVAARVGWDRAEVDRDARAEVDPADGWRYLADSLGRGRA